MAFKRARAGLRTSEASDARPSSSPSRSSEGMRKALVEDGLRQLVDTIDALSALESRLQLVEDDVTAGEALELPDLPTAKDIGITEFEPRLMETALLIGAITRRLNLRLGGMERALDALAPFDVEDVMTVRAPSSLTALAKAAANARVA